MAGAKAVTCLQDDLFGGGDPIVQFRLWYGVYPLHKAPRPAEKAFHRILAHREATFEQLIQGARAYAEDCRRRGTQQHFIAYPASWLNAGRWLDEYRQTASASTAAFAIAGARLRDARRDGGRWVSAFGDRPGMAAPGADD